MRPSRCALAARVPLAPLVALGLIVACRGGEGPRPSPPRWVEAGRALGLDRPTWCGSPGKEHLLESTGSGVAFLDLDGDGRDDVLVLNAWRLSEREPQGGARRVLERGRFQLWKNQGGGRLSDETERAGLTGGGAWATGVAAGDIDGDGDLDLHVTCFGPDLLYRNRGDGRFEEVAEAAGVADPAWGGGSAFFDADGDGDLDLYVANYIRASEAEVLEAERTLDYKGAALVMAGPFGFAGAVDRFYLNRGDGRFEEASERSGLVDRAEAYGLGVLAADLDADGDVDVYVANDSNPNYLFRNQGQGRFEEVGVVSGAAFDAGGAAQAGMGVATADFDGDGHLDIFVTNFEDDASTLYRGEGGLFFHDDSQSAGVAVPTYPYLSWGTLPVDFDRDGWLDLVVANGHIYPQVDALDRPLRYRQRLLLLQARAGQGFREASAAAGAGFSEPGSFRGLAEGDLDGDGGSDLVLTRIDEPPLLLRHEGEAPGGTLIVEPSPRPYPAWIGARIDVQAGDHRQSRVILSGGSYASQSTLRASFGLGAAEQADVVVRFVGGRTRRYAGVRPGRLAVQLEPPSP